MSNVLDKAIVLVLNRNWQAIDEKTVRDALRDLSSEGENGRAYRAFDISENPDGTLEYYNIVTWDEWLHLPVRPGDEFINCSRGRVIRAPTVIISSTYDRITVREQRFSKKAVHKRDNYQCQYCGGMFEEHEVNIDHIIPQSHDGETSWENVVCSCIECNSRKGNRRNEEIGYRLLKTPAAPKPLPSTIKFNKAKHPTWRHFI